MSNSIIKIYYIYDDELAEWEAVNREWRSDVFVCCNKNMYHLNVYTPVRLIQDYNMEIASYGFYSIDENIILVPKTDKTTIIATILKLYEVDFFEKIKSIEYGHEKALIQIY